jgi:predicted transcriptional regulator
MPSASTIVTLRVSDAMADEVRAIAERSEEKQSVILRRLLRLGLVHGDVATTPVITATDKRRVRD